MTRVLRLTRRYLRNADRLSVVPGSARARAVGRTIAALGADDELPAAGDVRALVPPTGVAYVRPVSGRNLWLWYVISGAEVTVVDPDAPIDVGYTYVRRCLPLS